MILGDVMVPGKSLRCDVCGYPWISVAVKLPTHCQNRECRSREWNGKKQRVRPTRIELPKQTKVRNEDAETDF
jgi:hypothetical protein